MSEAEYLIDLFELDSDAGSLYRRAAAELRRLLAETAAFKKTEIVDLMQANDELRAELASLRTALGEIAWSNSSKWQSDRAKAALATHQTEERKVS